MSIHILLIIHLIGEIFKCYKSYLIYIHIILFRY